MITTTTLANIPAQWDGVAGRDRNPGRLILLPAVEATPGPSRYGKGVPHLCRDRRK